MGPEGQMGKSDTRIVLSRSFHVDDVVDVEMYSNERVKARGKGEKERERRKGGKGRRTLIEKSHDTENLDLLDLPSVADLLTNLADIQGIVVTTSLSLGVGLSRILPGLL